jgi:hypothetical protein
MSKKTCCAQNRYYAPLRKRKTFRILSPFRYFGFVVTKAVPKVARSNPVLSSNSTLVFAESIVLFQVCSSVIGHFKNLVVFFCIRNLVPFVRLLSGWRGVLRQFTRI